MPLKLSIMSSYYTILLDDVERSVHLHRPSKLPAVNYFLIIHRCEAYNDYCQGKWIHGCLSYHSESSPVTYYSVTKRHQRLWRTTSLLINTMNAG